MTESYMWVSPEDYEFSEWHSELYPTREAAANAAIAHSETADGFYTGRLEKFNADAACDDLGGIIVEALANDANDNGGGRDDDWPNVSNDEVAGLSQLLAPVILEWLRATGNDKPGFGIVEDVMRHDGVGAAAAAEIWARVKAGMGKEKQG